MAGSFDFFVTNIEMDGNFLKLWGHKDKNSAQNVERIIQQKFQDFEKGIGVPDPHALVPDLLCCARYNDGGYYRARITHVDWSAGMVLCFFIDYGNRERVAICDLRTVDPYDALLKLAPQASCYLLSRVVGSWDPPALNFIKSAIMYSELKGVQVQSVGQINLLNLYVEGGQDFGEYLMRLGLASLVPAENFEVMVWRSLAVAVPQGLGCLGLGALPTATAPAYPFPLGPVGPVLQRPVLPLPSVIPPQPPAVSSIPHRLPAVDMKESTASRFPTYPTLQPNTEHTAFVSYCDKSSSTIYCQLSKDQPQLEALSAALNDPAVTKLVQLTPPYIPGRICVAKYTEDDQLYRGVITGVTDKVNVYFVDYGNSDTVPPSDVFEIPSDYSHHQVMALPFALASWNQADVSDEMFEILSDLINEHNVVLKVAASQDLSTKQLCDLFIDETNVTQLVNTELLRRKPKLTFRNIHFPTPGGKVEVVVAYVKSLNNFYVQLAAHQKDLEDKMAEVDSYCNGPAALMKAEDIVPGAPCCALFPADGQWYRAMILNASIEDLTVMYVDYGNEEKVTIADLRAANESIVNPLRAQAIPCRLTGFDVKADHQLVQRFEELVLEKTFTLHVLDLNEDVPCLWVKLLDENGTDITTSLKAPMHQINGHAIAPPASVKVAISGPGEREVVLSKESYRSRETTAKPVNHYQDRDRTRNARPIDQDLSTQCPKKDPAAWGIGEKRREKHSAIGHCDRDNGAYETESQASRKWNDAPQHPSIKYSTIATGDIKPVVIVFSNGPTDFNVQLRPTDSKFEMLSEQIEKLFSTGGSTLGRSLVVVGTACVARYKEDESFYRAEIKEVRKDGALVHFVDYGNNEVVNFEDLKEIPDEFLALPAQAFHCSLKGVSECTQDSLIKKFNDLLDYQSLEAEILDFRDHLYHVILRDSNDSLTINEQYGAALTDLLSPSSIVFSLPQLSISEGDSADVTVTWFKSPDNFYIMQKSFEAEFKKMMTALQEDYKSKEPVATPSIGHVVVARYTDGAFYRAEIVVKKDSKFGVQFLDYGNRCLVAPSCIFGLELQHAALPPLAIQCQLFGVKPIGNSWSNSSDILNLFHGNLKCSFKERSSKGFIVSCNSNGQDVADQLIVDKLAKSSLQEDHQTIPHIKGKKREMPVGSSHQAIFAYLEEPDKFFVHLESESSDLESLQSELQAAAEMMPPLEGPAIPGSLIMAIFEDAWYRGLVTATNKVFFLDYGNTEDYPSDSASVRKLPKHLESWPGFAIQCRFDRPASKVWSQNASEELVRIFDQEEKLQLKIISKSLDEDSFVVNLDGISEGLHDLWSDTVGVDDTNQDSVPIPVHVEKREMPVGSSHQAIFAYLEEPDKFFVHLESESSDLESLQSELQAAAEMMPPLEGPAIPGSLIMAIFEDAWYRGLVTATNKVFFLDYGNTEDYPSDSASVRKLPKHLESWPGFAIQCRFDRPASKVWSQNASEELVRIFDQEEKLQLKIISKSLDEDSFVVNLDGISEGLHDLWSDTVGVDDTNQDSVPIPVHVEKREMPVGSSHQAIFAYLEEPDKFFVHLESESSDLESLQSELQAAAEMMPPLEGPAIPGSLIMAIFEDAWYRGLVTATNKVFFLDYGNTEDYPSDSASVRKLPKHLESWPGFAIQCRFDRPASKVWSQNASEELVRIFDQEEKLQLKIISKSLDEDSFVVNLDGISEGLHDLWSDTVGVDDTNQDSVPIPVHVEKREMPVGSSHQAIFAYLEEPDKFFVHLESESSDLESLQSELQAAAEMMPPLEGPAIPGSLIMAIFEDAWYRGLVTATNKVFFLDYGNTEDYPSDSASVRKLPKHLESWPGFAIQCRFDRPASKVWSQNASEELVRIFDQEEKLQLKIISKSLDEDALVIYLDGISERLPDLWSDAVSANDTIEDSVPVPIHMKKREMAVGSSHEATFAFFDEPDVFYVNLQSEASDLENVQKQLQLASGNMPPLEGPATPGSLIMAIFEDAWYRALVTATNKVFFLDYGNTEDYPSDSASVRNLPKHLEIFPGFAIRCRFDRPASKAWSPNASEALVRIFDQKEKLQLTIISKSLDEDSFVVNLDGISEKLPLLWSDIPVDVDVIAKEEDCLMDGVGVGCNIVYLTSPDEFYVHLDSDAEKLEHIAQELLQADGFDTSQDWCEGDTCAALFDEDGVWYRAMVVSATPPSYKVRFVDYGNESESHALRKLPEKLLELPPLAYHCALPKPKDISWSCDTAKSKLETLVDSCDCKFTIELLTKEEPYLVSLYGNGVNLNLDIAVCCGYDPEIIRAHLSTLQVSRGKTIKLTTHLDDIETQVDEHQDLDLNVTPHLHPNGSVVNECVDSQGKGEQSAAADVAQIVEIGIPDVVLLRSHCDNEVKSGESLMACESGNGLGSVSDAFTEEAETLENLSANDKIIGNAEELAPSDSAVSLILNLSEHLAESVEIGSEEYPPRDIRDEEVKFEESLTVCEVDDGTGALSGAYIKEAETLDKLSINNECASSILVESLMSDFSERLEASKEADATEFGLAEECPQSDTCDNEAKSEEFCEVFGVMRASSESCSDHAGTLDKLPTIDEVVEKSEPAPSLSILSEHVAVSEEAEAVEMRSSEECVSRNLSGNGADNHFVNDVIDKSDLCLLGDSDKVKSDVSSTVNNSEEPCISDEVEILFEALKVSSLDDSVVEITETQIPVITIDDSDVDDNNCLPTNTPDEMPDLINSVNSLSVSNSGDLQCDIEEDTSTPCFVASLHTYPNAHNCELDIDGVHHGFSKASPSDFNLLEMAAGAKFYIFDDCQEHNNLVVTVKSS